MVAVAVAIVHRGQQLLREACLGEETPAHARPNLRAVRGLYGSIPINQTHEAGPVFTQAGTVA
jgi:hypothetical protein